MAPEIRMAGTHWRILCDHVLEIAEEVGFELFVPRVVRLQHGSKETCYFLGFWR
jgi:hypothetical protein